MQESEFKEWNEKMFMRYNNERLYHHPNPLIRYTENKRINLALKMLSPSETDRILDVGCGEGYILNRIKKGILFGLDISDTALSSAKEKLKNKSNIYLLKNNVQNTPFKDNSFDKILCTELLEHVISPENVVSEIARVSKKDAIIVITIPNEGLINKVKKLLVSINLFDVFLKDVPREMNREWHLHFFSLDYLKKVISGKLAIVEIQVTPFKSFPLRYIIKCRKLL